MKTRKTDKKHTPTGPRTYREDPITGLWKSEDGNNYRLDTHGTKPPHIDLIRVEGITP